MAEQLTEDTALEIVFKLGYRRGKQGRLSASDGLRLAHACKWLRENTDGQRLPEGVA